MILLGAGLLAACTEVTAPEPQPQTFDFDFTESTHGWQGGFSDHPPEWAERMELEAGHEALPEALGRDGNGLRITGSNQSDDLFMFWTGQVEGLQPDTRYQIRFEVEFATEAPSDCAGIGGPPGESVWVKVGATQIRPEPVTDQVGGRDYLQMNIDKGNQSMGGDDAFIIGDISNTNTDCLDWRWETKTLESEDEFMVTSDPDGALWLLVGTDSGFEGRTILYYIRYTAVLEPV